MTNNDRTAELTAAHEDAVRAYAEGRFDVAVEAFELVVDLLSVAERAVDPNIICNLAASLLGLKRADEALVRYRQAIALASEQTNHSAEAAAHAGLGYAAQYLRRFDEAVEGFRTAAERFGELGTTSERGHALAALGGCHYLNGQLSRAAAAFESATGCLRDPEQNIELIKLLTSLGGTLCAIGRPSDAIAALEEAAALLPAPYRGSQLEISILSNRGLALASNGRFEEAITALSEAKSGFAALGDADGQTRLATTLSDVCRVQGDLPSAIRHHQAMMRLEPEPGRRPKHSSDLHLFGVEDRSLSLGLGQAKTDDERARLAERAVAGDTVETIHRSHGQRPESCQHPFVVFAPPCPGTHGPLFPRGATAIASYLNANGIPSLVVPLSEYVDLRHSEETRLRRIDEVIADVIDTLDPRAVGISVTFSHLYPAGLDIARAVAAIEPELPIIIGGPHVSYWDKECLDEAPEIDVVVRGEGEWSALELLRTLETGGDLARVRGITWRDVDGGSHRNSLRPLGDVLELPEIDFGLLPERFAGRMEVAALTSRGCTFRCRFCHEFRYWGGAVRQYPVTRIVGEIERLDRLYSNQAHTIDDSMLDMADPYFIELMDAIGQMDCVPPDFGLLTRVDTITPEGLEAMKNAGLRKLTVGLESGSDAVLHAMNKGITIDTATRGLELVREAPIDLSAFFIVGHPGDNVTESERTLAYIDRLLRDELVYWVDMAMFIPYPGTVFFANTDKYGIQILTRDWRHWSRNHRPISQLADYSVNEIYLAYLRALEVQSSYLRARGDQ